MSFTGITTIEELLAVSITDLKRLGLLVPGAVRGGSLTWNRRGRTVASVSVITDTAGEIPTIRFQYTCNGSPVDYSTPLRFSPSNLNRGGFYYFVCPVTGRYCRKMYLVSGRFVSRFAFRALYDKQTRSRSQRTGLYEFLTTIEAAQNAINSKYRKSTYRGNLTPYGRKCEKIAARVKKLSAEMEAQAAADEKRRGASTETIADFGAFLE